MTRLAFDLETDGLLPDLTKIHCMSVADLDSDEKPDLYVGMEEVERAVRDRLAKAELLSAHNGIAFDWKVVNRFWPGELELERIWDTLTVARLREPWRKAQRLVDWGRELKVMKDDYSGGWETYSDEMGRYCIQDAVVQRALFNYLEPKMASWSPQSLENEFAVAYVISLQEEHGFRYDRKAAEALDAKLAQEQHELYQDIQDTFPPKWTKMNTMVPKRDNKTQGYVEGCKLTKVEYTSFNPGSPIQVADRLMGLGWKPREYTATGQPQVSEEIIAALRYPEVKTLVRWKNIEKQRGQIEGWMKAEKDGYVHGRVNSNGAYTGRMTHSKPNMANINKKDLRMREVWLPDEGDVLVGVDAEGLELRFLGHYLHQFDNGAYARAVVEGSKEDGTDAHSLLQKALGMHKRDNAKTFIYALIYGAGNPKLGRILADDAREAGKRLAGKSYGALGATARDRAARGIRGLDRLTESIQKQHQKRKWIWGLDRRKLRTQSLHSCLNTKIQGAGAVLMKVALNVLFYELAPERGLFFKTGRESLEDHWAFVANVHDEWQMTCHPNSAEKLAKAGCDAIEEAGKLLELTVPMSGSFDIGANWAETH